MAGLRLLHFQYRDNKLFQSESVGLFSYYSVTLMCARRGVYLFLNTGVYEISPISGLVYYALNILFKCYSLTMFYHRVICVNTSLYNSFETLL